MTMRAAAVVLLACLGVTLGGCVIYLNPLCNDQIVNGDETGIDCGGTCSAKCEIGGGCRTDVDCEDAICMGGVCTPKPCDNGVQDGQESDMDCGGTCRACPGGRKCVADTDCVGMSCNPATKTCSALSISFAPEVPYLSGHKPYVVLAADLDGDGRIDLAGINEYGNSIAVFRNAFGAGGTFEQLKSASELTPDDPGTGNFGPTGAYPTGGELADLNHDGKLDVVTADYHGDSVTVLLNDGTGKLNLRPAVSYPAQAGGATQNIAVGDLDHDGNLDLVATNPEVASISVLLGRADGTFGPANNLAVGIVRATRPYSVVIADFNGDGNNDLAITDDTRRVIIVRLGRGDATFGPEASYEILGGQSFFLVARDMNRDGKLDLVCANRSSDDVSVLLGRGDGTFRKAIVSRVSPPGAICGRGQSCFGPYALTVADVNRDGVLDVVTPNFQANSISILLGIGDGRFDPAIERKLATQKTPYGIVACDFDGDGKPDLATADTDPTAEDLAVLLSNGVPSGVLPPVTGDAARSCSGAGP